ncbi:MAG TPA: triose-phosphate isomerase [Pseudomonadales bacterium]
MSPRRPLVAGNWKMNGSSEFVRSFAAELMARVVEDAVSVVVFPPAAYLGALVRAFEGSAIEVGGQNAHMESSGAFTGEVAPEMVADVGGRWLLVGHSERRQYFGESDDLIADKYAAALRACLAPVLCVGETLEEREAGEAERVVCRQLAAVTERLDIAEVARGVVAYEPVWAIGTGRTATPGQAQEMHRVIREALSERGAKLAEGMRILYGGSVNADNAGELMAQPDIDGGLVGGASLSADGFAAIVAAAAGR